MQDVLSKELTGGSNVALPAQLEDTVMLFVRALHAMCQIQLQAGIALSAVVDVSDDGHESRLVCSRVEDGMKLPVQATPGGDVFLPTEFANVLAQNGVRLREVFLREMRNRQLEDFRLEQGADRK